VNRLGKVLPQRAQDRLHVWRVALRDRILFGAEHDIRDAMPERFVRAAYQIMLRRNADPGGMQNYLDHLERGTLAPDGVLNEMLTSMELREIPWRNLLRSMHQSRCDFVRMMPPAKRILDLGGTSQGEEAGALVSMGYPYPFEQLVIVDLPHDERHELYGYVSESDRIDTPLGPVQYRYHSMVDLSSYPDASFDLVVSGQTIEHITEDEARKMLGEARRVLEPGGRLCVDTPNRRATQLHLGEQLSNPDHKIEYTAASLRALVEEAGFEITGEYGLNHLGEPGTRGEYDDDETSKNHGVYADAANCYTLAFVCRSRP
jgi:SAM-dependent methyltransferase